MKVLHIHSDYPDGSDYASTLAVKLLLDETCGVSHTVFVIHRTPWPWQTKIIKTNDQLYSVYYWGLPFGLALSLSLYIAYHSLLKLIKNNHIDYQLVHGHKFAIDGTLGAALANKVKVPYFLSVRGGTDMRFLRHKLLLRRHWKKVIQEARHVFWVSAWAKSPILKILNLSTDCIASTSSLLPNLCCMEPLAEGNRTKQTANFVTVFRFDLYKSKGIMPLLEAVAKLRLIYPGIRLDIYGSGPKNNIEAVRDKISALALDKHVTIKGRIDNQNLQQELVKYSAFLLPSNIESFGMVYVEALFSGLPILYHAGTGIDGYLDGLNTGVKVYSQNSNELASKVEMLILQHDLFNARVKSALKKNLVDIFGRKTIVQHYQRFIDEFSLEQSNVE